MADKLEQETPLMKQYNQIKAKHPGAILLFRVGDFYETFAEDAVKTAAILGITLTKRANGKASEIALAGFPYHAIDNYLPKLVKAGQRVAVCEQLEDPKLAKGIVKRGVTELVTPGIVLSDRILEQTSANYLACIHFPDQQHFGAAFTDISTGDFFCCSGPISSLEKILSSLNPSEIIIARKDYKKFQEKFGENWYLFRLEDWVFQSDTCYELLINHFKTNNLKGFGIEDETYAWLAAGVILHYLRENEQKNLSHISRIYLLRDAEFVYLDKFTIRNLELLQSSHPEGTCLKDILDTCTTSMGSRLLRRWMIFPLRQIKKIQARQACVLALTQQNIAQTIQKFLQLVPDLERLAAKIATARISPRECRALVQGLKQMQPIAETLADFEAFHAILESIPNITPAIELIDFSIQTEAPALLSQGNVINPGVSQELDELRILLTGAKAVIDEMEEREIKRTGIPSLKISFNRVTGYYIEITKTHKDKIPTDYDRKQTLTNAERYITPELKEFEEKVLSADEKTSHLEQVLFTQFLQELLNYLAEIQKVAQIISGIDVLVSFAEKMNHSAYILPEVHDGNAIEIKAGRHPVIETLLPADKPYIPNDVYLDNEQQQILIITGPNMAGKSALLRQTALITLMAQMGSAVPANFASIGLVDKIFTRVGASDNLSAGESTFMVEMQETAQIINTTTEKSLILLDEIGRGTSTYDGLSIAWSLVEYLHETSGARAKTLFATHYHELAELANLFPRVKNYHVSVKELDGRILFMRKLQPGHSEHSFGIQVASMAGLPHSLVNRAKELLQGFEGDKVKSQEKAKKVKQASNIQMNLFELKDEDTAKIRQLMEFVDVDRMTPLEALVKLQEIKKILQEK